MTVVTVVGSANADTSLTVNRIPVPGETMLASAIATTPGGKGLNQAIAAQRADAETTLIAAIGSDAPARVVLSALEAAGMPLEAVRRVHEPTGSAMIAVDAAGENSIIVVPAANQLLLALSRADRRQIERSRVVVCQLEVPLSVVVDAAQAAREAGAIFVINPSPVVDLPAGFLEAADIVVVNEGESRALGIEHRDLACVVTTLGGQGAVVHRRNREPVAIGARRARVVDTTGAGDTFVGALAAELARGADIIDAARRAVVAASLAVEHRGAVPSIPDRDRVDAALAAMQ